MVGCLFSKKWLIVVMDGMFIVETLGHMYVITMIEELVVDEKCKTKQAEMAHKDTIS